MPARLIVKVAAPGKTHDEEAARLRRLAKHAELLADFRWAVERVHSVVKCDVATARELVRPLPRFQNLGGG